MPEEPVMQPVEVFLPVRLKQRGGKFNDEWWVRGIDKREDFDASDFTPFAIASECEETGYRSRWDFPVALVDQQARKVVLGPHEIARSKSWPLERALHALDWKRCPATEVPN
jgi:hypothetical protein